MREKGQCLADPLDDERQEADVRQDVEERHDEEDRQQGRGEEVHLRHMDPVRECEGDALVGDADEPGEARGRGLDDVAPDRERGQEPGDEHVEREQRADTAPVDVLALLREKHADGQEDQHAEEIDDEIHMGYSYLFWMRSCGHRHKKRHVTNFSITSLYIRGHYP